LTRIRLLYSSLFVIGWLFLFPPNFAYADNPNQVQATPSNEPVLDTSAVISQIISSANTSISNAETTTAQVVINSQSINNITETVTATISAAQESIITAQSTVEVAAESISNVESKTVLANAAVAEKNTAISNLETATARVNTQTQIVALDSAAVVSAQSAVDGSTVTVQTPGLTAQTYNIQGQNNAPVLSENAQPISTITVPYVYFYWGSGQVLNSGKVDDVIVKFTGQINAPENATELRYAVYSDDGARLIIDGEEVIDNWVDQGPTWSPYSNWFDVTTDKNQNLELWYYENGGGANVVLGWDLRFDDGSGYFTSPMEDAFTTTTTTKDPELVQALTNAQTTLATDTGILNTYINQKNTASGILTQKNQAANVAVSNLTSATNDMNIKVTLISPAISNMNSAVSAANSIVNNTLAQEEAVRQEIIRVEQARQEAIAEANAQAAYQAQLQAEAEAQAAAEAAAQAEAEAQAAAEAAAQAEAEAQEQAEANAKAEAEAQAAAEAAAQAEAEAQAAAEAAAQAEAEAKQAEQDAIDKAIEDALDGKELTEEQKDLVVEALLEKSDGEAVSLEDLKKSGLEYKDLPPTTPVDVRTDENGNAVIINASVAAQVELLQNPSELLSTAFSDPGAAIAALGSIGADMSEAEREEATDMVVATVVAAGAAINAAAVATGGATGSSTGGGGSSGGGSGANSPGSRGGRRW